jgi:hypothetical protein
MSEEHNSNSMHSNMSYYVSLFSGAMLAISELLPYISKVKGNGIIQVIMNAYGAQKKQEEEQAQQNEKKLDDILARLEELKNIQLSKQSEPKSDNL